jgi:Pentapeptide repeats (8 copies)
MHDRLATKRLRFNLRTGLVFVAFFALVIGWYTSTAQQRARSAWLVQQLMNARSQIQLAESRAEIQADAHANNDSTAKGLLSGAKLEGMNLRDAVIGGGTSAFQKARFDRSDLSNASLTGGVASFQGASFNNAILRNAKLAGGGSSFQLATFENADLSGAVLTGNLQAVSLRNAKCIGTTISGSFGGANISTAQFQNADLSAVRSEDLASCYSDAPPEYDANTKFPERFDPITHGWKKTDAASRAPSR